MRVLVNVLLIYFEQFDSADVTLGCVDYGNYPLFQFRQMAKATAGMIVPVLVLLCISLTMIVFVLVSVDFFLVF